MAPAILLGAIAIGAIAVYALTKKPATPPGGFGGTFQGQLPPIPVPVPQSGGGGTNLQWLPPHISVTPGAFPANTVVVSDGQGQQIQIPLDIPSSLVNGDNWRVNTPSGIFLRSAPSQAGGKVGEGNVIDAIPNGEVVKAVANYQDQNGFKRIQRTNGSVGWGYTQYLQKVSGVSV